MGGGEGGGENGGGGDGEGGGGDGDGGEGGEGGGDGGEGGKRPSDTSQSKNSAPYAPFQFSPSRPPIVTLT